MKPPLFTLFFSLLFLNFLFAQTANCNGELNLVFYNVENLFDGFNDLKTADDEFLPQGIRHWTKRRFERKISNISKVILSSCGFEMPDIVGLCEVENRYVLDELVGKTALKNYNYSIIHKDSPDARGIDVALLYRKNQCKPLSFEYIPLKDKHGDIIRSREILYARFEIQPKDTMHVFFNHWPSRYGGQSETEHKRIGAAKQLRTEIDKLKQEYLFPKIVLMGDFNDAPNNKSMSEVIGAVSKDNLSVFGELVNLSSVWQGKGTLKHRQGWVSFDQVLITDYLLSNVKGWKTNPNNAQIVNLSYLLEDDPKFMGKRLFRTYYGMKYKGGFSDHLPIRLKLVYSD